MKSKGRAYGTEIGLKALNLYPGSLNFKVVGRFLEKSNVRVVKKRIRQIGKKLFQEGTLWKNTDLKSVD